MRSHPAWCSLARLIVVAVDPPASTGEHADECGIIVAGRGEDGQGYVLADCSSRGDAPEHLSRFAGCGNAPRSPDE